MIYSMKFLLLVLFACVVHPFTISSDEYEKSRQLIIKAEEKLMLGGRLVLSDKEEKVDGILKKIKMKEVRKRVQLYTRLKSKYFTYF